MWTIEFTKYAQKDYQSLDHSQKILVDKALKKASINPLPKSEGGYGECLKGNLKDFLKIKLVTSGIRIIYQLTIENNMMSLIVIGMRKDEEAYKTAKKRKLLLQYLKK